MGFLEWCSVERITSRVGLRPSHFPSEGSLAKRVAPKQRSARAEPVAHQKRPLFTSEQQLDHLATTTLFWKAASAYITHIATEHLHPCMARLNEPPAAPAATTTTHPAGETVDACKSAPSRTDTPHAI